jgi:hypothetical protein
MGLTKATFSMISGAPINVLDYGAVGDGVTDNTAAIQAALTAGAGKAVYIPAGNYKLTSYVSVPNNTTVYGDGVPSRLFANGTVGELMRGVWPCDNVTIDGIYFDGGKTSGTATVVVCFYTSADITASATQNLNITIQNCKFKNASAGIGIENGKYVSIRNNTISHMYRHTSGTYSGVYGYGVVLNGCTRSSVTNNIIGETGGLIQRHGIYLPTFRNADVSPSVLVFTSELIISNNIVHVDFNPGTEPYSSCIEAWNFFDFLIEGNMLIGGVRGINASPEYQNGSRVQIVSNTIKDNSICIRNGPATYTTGTYFENYLIDGNTLLPLTSVAHQCVKLQGVKNIVFTDNFCRGGTSSTFAFGYYDTVESITADSIQASSNRITGFLQGYYLGNVVVFTDTATVFSNFTSTTAPYNRITAVSYSEMTPLSTPYEEYYSFSSADWTGVSYFSNALLKEISYNSSFWQDAMGIRVRGTTANRPNSIGLPYGFKYYDTDVGSIVTWNGAAWV